jgi:hypothetical protein
MAIYEKPTWQLVKDSLPQLPEIFSTEDALNWFHSKYPKIKDSTVRAHVIGMSLNSPSRRHYSGLLAHGLLYKVDRHHYTRYDPQRHGTFDEHGRQVGIGDSAAEEGAAEALPEYPTEEQAEFALEQHLEEFMERNWVHIDFGMAIDIWVDPDGISGRQYPTSVGNIDFLCKERESGSFVVVELKKGGTTDTVVGQCQRYMGWVKQHLEREGKPVFGLIVASDVDERLSYALAVTPQIRLRLYRVKFDLVAPEDFSA